MSGLDQYRGSYYLAGPVWYVDRDAVKLTQVGTIKNCSTSDLRPAAGLHCLALTQASTFPMHLLLKTPNSPRPWTHYAPIALPQDSKKPEGCGGRTTVD